MPAQIDAFLISLIWIDVDLTAPASEGPLSKLLVRAEYETIVDQLRTSNGYGDGLRLPWWRKKPPHFFWLYYFEQLLPDKVSGDKAWQSLAPLQLSRPLAKLAQATDVAGDVRGYVSPLGTAIVAELRGRTTTALDPWVDRCHAIRNDDLTVSIEGEVDRQQRLADLATDLRADLRTRLGQAPATHALPEPFTIVTALKGDGVTPTSAPAKAIRQRVHAVAAWPAEWRQVVADTANDIPLRARDRAAGDLLYGTSRGRAVWMPSRFMPKPVATPPDPKAKPAGTLTCYHHNLSLASLQTATLLGFVRELNGLGGEPPLALKPAVRRAAGLLGRLYGGADDMYQSACVSRQISDSGLIPSIDKLRAPYGMPPLKLRKEVAAS